VSLVEEASPVERAREVLRELTEEDAAAWAAWAWEARATLPAYVADAAREVAHDVERIRRSLRQFVAEHERAAAEKEKRRPPGSASTPNE
jgi:hypothetical protein